mmetsp:Transcript_3739/g.9896  ORF Transcript_3739/g.9896 Transcript_3739/m.9896 type:complete len:117 (-) Transcript_3739:12-362(-)
MHSAGFPVRNFCNCNNTQRLRCPNMKLIAATALISVMASALPPFVDAAGSTWGVHDHFGINSEVDHAHKPTIEELNFSRTMFMKIFHDAYPDLSMDGGRSHDHLRIEASGRLHEEE